MKTSITLSLLLFSFLNSTTAHANSIYWSLFNIEGENTQNSNYVTYDSLSDMVSDTNRTGVYAPGGGFGKNIVGSGSEGTTFWSLFNIEGEGSQNSVYVTYNSLLDMANDTNRTGAYVPDGFGAGQNVVGSGSDGTTFWSLFNIEGESSQNSVYVTYDSLLDMANDTNRTGAYVPDGFGAGQNVVGSGAFTVAAAPVPLPPTLWLLAIGLACLGTLQFANKRQNAC